MTPAFILLCEADFTRLGKRVGGARTKVSEHVRGVLEVFSKAGIGGVVAVELRVQKMLGVLVLVGLLFGCPCSDIHVVSNLPGSVDSALRGCFGNFVFYETFS